MSNTFRMGSGTKKRNRSGSFNRNNNNNSSTGGLTTDSGKRSDDGDSQEEFDSSTDVIGGSGGGAVGGIPPNSTKLNNGVRCSARVIEKQEKLRRELSPAKQSTTVQQQQHTSSFDHNHGILVSSTQSAHLPLHGDAAELEHSHSDSGFSQGSSPTHMALNSHTNDHHHQQQQQAIESSSSSVGMAKDLREHHHREHRELHHPSQNQQPTHTTSSGSINTNASNNYENKKSAGGGGVGAGADKRKKRNWEVWSQDDKLHFFEALNEYGKDFDAIQSHLASKQKSRAGRPGSLSSGNAVVVPPKNKDQVRHFYYRTWHKIAKHLKFPKDMKRANQELYGLVNYGELRKKQRVLNVKNAAKLCELMEKGMTTIKVRGKTFRIKTPVCRAIKRMNLLDDEHSRVPCKITVELSPVDRRAWATVQSVAHNPRVVVQVPPQRTLASLITYFEERWKSSTERLKEQFIPKNCGKRPAPRLRFIPTIQPQQKEESTASYTTTARVPIFKMSECTNSATISLRSYTEKVLHKPLNNSSSGGKESEETQAARQLKEKSRAYSLKRKQSSSGNHSDSHGEHEFSDADAPPGAPPSSERLPTNSQLDHFHTQTSGEEENKGKSTTHDNANNATALDDHHTQQQQNFCGCSPAVQPGGGGVSKWRSGETEDVVVGHVWDEEALRRGWAAREAELMTMGELYLSTGAKCERLAFTYCWDTPAEDRDREGEARLADRLLEVARTLRKRKSIRTKAYNNTSSGAAAAINSSTVVCMKCGTPCVPPPTAATGVPLGPPLPAAAAAVPPVLPETITFIAGTDSNSDPPPQQLVPQISKTSIAPLTNTPAPAAAPPPKPFMDLTKGNRRLNRINSRRFMNFIRLPMQQQGQQQAPQSLQPLPFGGGPLIPVQQQQQQIGAPVAPVVPAPTSTPAEGLSIRCSPGELEQLLHGEEGKDPEGSTFSLSSFMDISLPESTRLAADDVSLNVNDVDKLLQESTPAGPAKKHKSCAASSGGLNTPSNKSPCDSRDNMEIEMGMVLAGGGEDAIGGGGRQEKEQGKGTGNSNSQWPSESTELSFTNLLTSLEMNGPPTGI